MKMEQAIIDLFGPRFVPDGVPIYSRANGFAAQASASKFKPLHESADEEMPDVILYCRKREWLFLIDIPEDERRFDASRSRRLRQLFSATGEHVVLVAAFESRLAMATHVETMPWDVVAWVCDEPSHLIHFDGHRIFGTHTMT